MRKQTWQQWARACAKDPTSPSELGKGSLAALTGQDVKALDAIAACWELYARSDEDGRRGALSAVVALLPTMQPSTQWIARELIPFALDWHDRARLWPLVTTTGLQALDPDGQSTGTTARAFAEMTGRAGHLPPKAQAEFDARDRS